MMKLPFILSALAFTTIRRPTSVNGTYMVLTPAYEATGKESCWRVLTTGPSKPKDFASCKAPATINSDSTILNPVATGIIFIQQYKVPVFEDLFSRNYR